MEDRDAEEPTIRGELADGWLIFRWSRHLWAQLGWLALVLGWFAVVAGVYAWLRTPSSGEIHTITDGLSASVLSAACVTAMAAGPVMTRRHWVARDGTGAEHLLFTLAYGLVLAATFAVVMVPLRLLVILLAAALGQRSGYNLTLILSASPLARMLAWTIFRRWLVYPLGYLNWRLYWDITKQRWRERDRATARESQK